MSLYLSPLAGTELGNTLEDLGEANDRDIARITAAIARIATRARNGHLDRQHTQLLLASIAGSPDGLDLVGALGLLIADLTTNNPALDELTDDARKDAERHGQEAALILQHDDLRRAASDACESLDHTN